MPPPFSETTIKHGKKPKMTYKSDLLERYRSKPLCTIQGTNIKKKNDLFDAFRPSSNTVLDYNISQTDTKLQQVLPHGLTKVHVQQTTANYVLPPSGYEFPQKDAHPPPPSFAGVKYFSGRAPVWRFIDDIWRKKVEKRQKLYHMNLAQLTVKNRKCDAAKRAIAHANLTKLIGPDWYQELSPQQLRTVDNLKNCIMKDIKTKTFINTQENIAQLGVLLRPNPLYIQMALNQCCECPVEFLLILYQLMNKRRTEYSINDRLLLSGVVHLTMRETLKELHVRIPSPPPPLPEIPKPPKPKKVKRYKSPYLVPYDYVPKPPKHTGIYKNYHIQYPESPYFSYVSELKAEIQMPNLQEKVKKAATRIRITNKQSGITDEQETEIINELKLAQKLYNELVDYKPVSLLFKPSIYIPCDHGMNFDSLDSVGVSKKKQGDQSISFEVKLTSNYDECRDSIDRVCECRITFNENEPTFAEAETDSIASSIAELKEVASENISKEESTLPEITCKNFGVAIDVSETPINKEPTDSGIRSFPISENETLVIAGERKSFECNCYEKAKEIVENTNLCQCDRCKADRLAEQSEVKEEPCDETTNVKANARCDCLKKYQSKLKKYEELKNRYYAPYELASMNQSYIIGGVCQGPDGKPVYNLLQTVPTYECPCVQLHRQQLEEEKRLGNMPKIPLQKPKYVISGVRPTPEGNVFVVSGAVATQDCTCMKMFKEYEKRHNVCLDAYQKFLEKIKMDKEEYMREFARDNEFKNVENKATCDPEICAKKNLSSVEAEESEIKETIATVFPDRKELEKILECCDENDIYEECCCKNEVCEEESEPTICTCKADIAQCKCNEEDDEEDGEEDDEEESFESVDDSASELRRFIILKIIPCERNKHIEILKKALDGMAEDGFPLAKLPDSWKLPHFKLWMQLRCGKSWSQEDRVDLLVQSWIHWRHADYCSRKVKEKALLDMSKEEARKYTWSQANTVRRIALEKETIYYRQMRQTVIDDAREFFPSTFTYELPTENFRKCFFAYTPAKEEECISWRPWFPHEIKKLKK